MSCTSIADGIRPRKVDAKELIARAGESGAPAQKPPGVGRILDSSKLADVFGIDFGGADPKPSHIPAAKKGKSQAPRTYKSAKRVGKQSAHKKSGTPLSRLSRVSFPQLDANLTPSARSSGAGLTL